MGSIKEHINQLFPESVPAKWQYGLLYLFLALWMQGEAFLNIIWPLLLLVSLPYISFAFERIKTYRWLWISIVSYLSVRLFSVAFAMDSKLAALGIIDDLRVFTIGLLLLTYIRTKDQLKKSVIATLAGFGVLAWHALLLHWFTTHSLAPAQNVEFGSLAHVNYAAAFTSVVLFSILVASRHVSKRWLFAITLIAIPLCILQAPLSSRTTLLLLAITVVGYLVYKRPGWITAGMILSSIVLVLGVLSQQRGLDQFNGIEKPTERPSIYIRIDIWKTLFHVWKENPLGIGPRNFNLIDLNQYREWIHQNTPLTAKLFYGEAAMNNGLQGIDLNKTGHFVTDPHNHYVGLFTESGPLALLAFLSYLLAAFVLAIRHSHVKNNWTSAFGEAAAGGLFLMSSASVMVALFYQSGGIITIMLIGFLLTSIDIHGTEKDNVLKET